MAAGATVFALAIFALAAGTADGSSCEMASTNNLSELTNTLSERAVEIVKRASAPGWRTDLQLKQLVQSSAVADLGSGDVGRPLGEGISGSHALAQQMQAETFTYLGWGGIPGPADPVRRTR